MSGHPAPRRQAGQAVAGALGAGSERSGGRVGRREAAANHIVAHTLNAKGGAGRSDSDSDSETFVPVSVCNTLDAAGDKGGTLQDAVAGRLLTIPIQGIGKGTGKSTIERKAGDWIGSPDDPSFTLGTDSRHGVAIAFDETQITSAANRCNPQPDDACHPLASGARPPTIAFSAKDHGADAMADLSPTLRAGGHHASHANAGVMPAIAFHARQDPDSGPVTHPLDTDGGSIGILTNWRVRRLTPTECERLQGFPDGYTLVPGAAKGGWRDVDETEDVEDLRALGLKVRLKGNVWRVKDPDVPRYKALGNSMAVNVMRWIGQRIALADALGRAAA